MFKTLGLSCLGFLVFQKFSQWYRNIAETELILDQVIIRNIVYDRFHFYFHCICVFPFPTQTDHSLKSFGSNLNGLGVSFLASLNHTAIEECGYSDLFKKMETVIQLPRFPQNLKEYSQVIGREVADLINQIERILRLRLHSDFLVHQRLVMTPVEITVLQSFQRGIVLLQARQADATIRMLRLQVLAAANECEDQIERLHRKAMERSQNLRLPLPRFILLNTPFLPVARGIRASTLDRLKKVFVLSLHILYN